MGVPELLDFLTNVSQYVWVWCFSWRDIQVLLCPSLRLGEALSGSARLLRTGLVPALVSARSTIGVRSSAKGVFMVSVGISGSILQGPYVDATIWAYAVK